MQNFRIHYHQSFDSSCKIPAEKQGASLAASTSSKTPKASSSTSIHGVATPNIRPRRAMGAIPKGISSSRYLCFMVLGPLPDTYAWLFLIASNSVSYLFGQKLLMISRQLLGFTPAARATSQRSLSAFSTTPRTLLVAASP